MVRLCDIPTDSVAEHETITAHFTNHCPNRTASFSLIALVIVCAIARVLGHLRYAVAKRRLPVNGSPSYIRARPRNLNQKESSEMAEIQNDPVANVIEDLYPLAQVAKILRCSRKSVYRLISSGRLNAVRWGRSYRFRREDIQRFVRNSAIASRDRK
jgi:excisionase family DNA binding protein